MERRILQLFGAGMICVLAHISPSWGYAQSETLEERAADSKRASVETVTPADVLQRVQVAGDEVELIRAHLGKLSEKRDKIRVRGARPREVYFQALTLFRKANRLALEQVQSFEVESEQLLDSRIGSSDVRQVVDSALKRIRIVKQHLGIHQEVEERFRNPDVTPDNVFQSVVQVNRQLNLMLDREFAPADVFEKVTQALGLTSRLLEPFPEIELKPLEPTFEPGKKPFDVMGRLFDCLELIEETMQKAGFEMLDFSPTSILNEDVTPSDVYDIASLVLSELIYLHSKIPSVKPPFPPYFPGEKTPSDVFQRAGALGTQLTRLKNATEANPTVFQKKG